MNHDDLIIAVSLCSRPFTLVSTLSSFLSPRLALLLAIPSLAELRPSFSCQYQPVRQPISRVGLRYLSLSIIFISTFVVRLRRFHFFLHVLG